MSDRELLELAAKAAGLEFMWMPISGMNVVSGPKSGLWNPLTDGGLALDLAISLGIAVFPPDSNEDDFAVASIPDGLIGDDVETWIQVPMKDGDKHAATRRAIVRAAAEIGRGMK